MFTLKNNQKEPRQFENQTKLQERSLDFYLDVLHVQEKHSLSLSSGKAHTFSMGKFPQHTSQLLVQGEDKSVIIKEQSFLYDEELVVVVVECKEKRDITLNVTYFTLSVDWRFIYNIHVKNSQLSYNCGFLLDNKKDNTWESSHIRFISSNVGINSQNLKNISFVPKGKFDIRGNESKMITLCSKSNITMTEEYIIDNINWLYQHRNGRQQMTSQANGLQCILFPNESDFYLSTADANIQKVNKNGYSISRLVKIIETQPSENIILKVDYFSKVHSKHTLTMRTVEFTSNDCVTQLDEFDIVLSNGYNRAVTVHLIEYKDLVIDDSVITKWEIVQSDINFTEEDEVIHFKLQLAPKESKSYKLKVKLTATRKPPEHQQVTFGFNFFNVLFSLKQHYRPTPYSTKNISTSTFDNKLLHGGDYFNDTVAQLYWNGTKFVTTGGGFNFATPATGGGGGFNFGAPATTTGTGFTFGTPSTTTTGFSFGETPSTTTAPSVSGFSLNSGNSNANTTGNTSFTFGSVNTGSNTSNTGFNFPSSTTTTNTGFTGFGNTGTTFGNTGTTFGNTGTTLVLLVILALVLPLHLFLLLLLALPLLVLALVLLHPIQILSPMHLVLVILPLLVLALVLLHPILLLALVNPPPIHLLLEGLHLYLVPLNRLLVMLSIHLYLVPEIQLQRLPILLLLLPKPTNLFSPIMLIPLVLQMNHLNLVPLPLALCQIHKLRLTPLLYSDHLLNPLNHPNQAQLLLDHLLLNKLNPIQGVLPLDPLLLKPPPTPLLRVPLPEKIAPQFG